MTSWRAGSLPLPAATSLSLPVARHTGTVGLLCSDILSHFHSVNVTCAKGRLTLLRVSSRSAGAGALVQDAGAN